MSVLLAIPTLIVTLILQMVIVSRLPLIHDTEDLVLLANLHGRMGYFPPILRMRPVEGAIPPRFELAEVINLQALRDAARKERY
mgnify:CR=1 FL=1